MFCKYRMYYYLYRITNKVNNKIYVGVHMTKSLDDGYMGSGKVIRAAITKHGLENFHKEILETFDDAASMYEREKQVVNEEFLCRDDVYNLRRGGTGGFDYIGRLLSEGATVKFKGKKHSAETKELIRLKNTGKRHSDETKRKISASQSVPSEQKSPKLSKSLSGRKLSSEHRKKLSLANLGKTGRKIKQPAREQGRKQLIYEVVLCPHCGARGKKNAMNRWHFTNCKSLGD